MLAAAHPVHRRARSSGQPSVARHEGRVVKFVGDGAINEFGSTFAAVACADEIQSVFVQGRIDVALWLPSRGINGRLLI